NGRPSTVCRQIPRAGRGVRPSAPHVRLRAMQPDAELKKGRANVAPTYGVSPFPPIAEYGFLSDGEVTAHVAPSGNIEWLCLPRIDSPSVFGAMLDRDAGGFRFGPSDVMVPA